MTTIALNDWYREFPRFTIGGSLYSAPADLRVDAARQLAANDCRVHIDIIIGANGHRGVTWPEIVRVHETVPVARLDLHLILLDGVAPIDEEVRVLDAAHDLGVVGVTLPAGTIDRHREQVAALRAAGVQVFVEAQPADPGPSDGPAAHGGVDGCMVMFIPSGTKQQADPAMIDKVARLSANLPVAVDGGITRTLAPRIHGQGATYLVSGRDLFQVGTDPSDEGATPMTDSQHHQTSGEQALAAVGAEIAGVLGRVEADNLAVATTFLANPDGRWFFTGQGRSGLVARMVAMRFMHLGRAAHLVFEATAPSIQAGDHLVAFSASGSTPITLHLAQLATGLGADLLAVSASDDNPLSRLAAATLVVPAPTSRQFGGSLFEQCALVLMDAVVLDLTAADAEIYQRMAHRHTNLQ